MAHETLALWAGLIPGTRPMAVNELWALPSFSYPIANLLS